jgi:hypothetical protein
MYSETKTIVSRTEEQAKYRMFCEPKNVRNSFRIILRNRRASEISVRMILRGGDEDFCFLTKVFRKIRKNVKQTMVSPSFAFFTNKKNRAKLHFETL